MADASSAAAAFPPDWSSSYSVTTFLPGSPHKRKQRAWERQPRPAFAPSKQSRRIWKRYDTRQPSQVTQHNELNAASPAKVVKKLRVVNEVEAMVNFKEKHGVAAKWDRRKSGLPHKARLDVDIQETPATSETRPEAGANTNDFIDDEIKALGNEYLQGIENNEDDTLSITSELQEEQLRAQLQLPAAETSPGETTSVTESEIVIVTVSGPIAPAIEESPEKNNDALPREQSERRELEMERESTHAIDDNTPARDSSFLSTVDATTNIPSSPTKPPIQEDDADAGLFDLSPVKPTSLSAKKSPSNINQSVSPAVSSQSSEAMDLALEIEPEVDVLAENESEEGMAAFQEEGEDDTEAFEVADATETVDSDAGSQSPASYIDGYETQTVDMKFASYEPTVENTVTTTMVDLNDDTDFINDFLSRAKANKAAKIAKRSSLSHKRDSDAVRLALASPRKVLEDIDANSPSPRKPSESRVEGSINFVEPEASLLKSTLPSTPTRRSLRSAIQSRTKTPAANAPSSVSLRRGDGSECLVIKKTESQELAQITRNNTRRNKCGAVPVMVMLKKLANVPSVELEESDAIAGGKTVRWNERLVDYFAKPGEVVREGDDGSELTEPAPVARARARRVRALGAVNGTPARKNAFVEEPDVKEEKKAKASRRIPTPSKPVKALSVTIAKEEKEKPVVAERLSESKAEEPSRTRRRSIIPRSKASSRV